MPAPTLSSQPNPVSGAIVANQLLAQITPATTLGVFYLVHVNVHFQGTVTTTEFDNVYLTTSNSPNLKLLCPSLNNNGQMYPAGPFVVVGDGGNIQLKTYAATGGAVTYWCEVWATPIDDVEGIVPSA